MAEADDKKGKELALLVYVLQAVGFVIGLTWIVGVIINYVKRDDVRGTWIESHFDWQIKTFWIGLAGWIVGVITVWILIGWLILLAVTVWASPRGEGLARAERRQAGRHRARLAGRRDDRPAESGRRRAAAVRRDVAHIVYALHTFAIVVGIAGTRDRHRQLRRERPVDRRGDPQLREARRRARHLGRVALPLADPHLLVRGAVDRDRVAADHHDPRCRHRRPDPDRGDARSG